MTLVSNEVWVQMAQERGIASDDLDEFVHEAFADMAADVNNGGLEAQIAFLRRTVGDAALEDMLVNAKRS